MESVNNKLIFSKIYFNNYNINKMVIGKIDFNIIYKFLLNGFI
jgi:hypothetical protein